MIGLQSPSRDLPTVQLHFCIIQAKACVYMTCLEEVYILLNVFDSKDPAVWESVRSVYPDRVGGVPSRHPTLSPRGEGIRPSPPCADGILGKSGPNTFKSSVKGDEVGRQSSTCFRTNRLTAAIRHTAAAIEQKLTT